MSTVPDRQHAVKIRRRVDAPSNPRRRRLQRPRHSRVQAQRTPRGRGRRAGPPGRPDDRPLAGAGGGRGHAALRWPRSRGSWSLARQSVQRVADALEAGGLVGYADNPRHRRARLGRADPGRPRSAAAHPGRAATVVGPPGRRRRRAGPRDDQPPPRPGARRRGGPGGRAAQGRRSPRQLLPNRRWPTDGGSTMTPRSGRYGVVQRGGRRRRWRCRRCGRRGLPARCRPRHRLSARARVVRVAPSRGTARPCRPPGRSRATTPNAEVTASTGDGERSGLDVAREGVGGSREGRGQGVRERARAGIGTPPTSGGSTPRSDSSRATEAAVGSGLEARAAGVGGGDFFGGGRRVPSGRHGGRGRRDGDGAAAGEHERDHQQEMRGDDRGAVDLMPAPGASPENDRRVPRRRTRGAPRKNAGWAALVAFGFAPTSG